MARQGGGGVDVVMIILVVSCSFNSLSMCLLFMRSLSHGLALELPAYRAKVANVWSHQSYELAALPEKHEMLISLWENNGTTLRRWKETVWVGCCSSSRRLCWAGCTVTRTGAPSTTGLSAA